MLLAPCVPCVRRAKQIKFNLVSSSRGGRIQKDGAGAAAAAASGATPPARRCNFDGLLLPPVECTGGGQDLVCCLAANFACHLHMCVRVYELRPS